MHRLMGHQLCPINLSTFVYNKPVKWPVFGDVSQPLFGVWVKVDLYSEIGFVQASNQPIN